MGIIAKPHTFSPNTTATSSEVNSDFDTIYNEFNGNIAAANLATDAVTTAKIADSNITTAKIADANVTTAKLADSSVTAAKLDTGIPVQVVSTAYTAVATGSDQCVLDDTIPQSNEGDEYMTQAITPKSATNILVIEVVAMLTCDAIRTMIGHIDQDAATDALAAGAMRIDTAGQPYMFKLRHRMVAGTTSSTTFRFRAGVAGTGTNTFNGSGGARVFGAIAKSTITVTEYKAS